MTYDSMSPPVHQHTTSFKSQFFDQKFSLPSNGPKFTIFGSGRWLRFARHSAETYRQCASCKPQGATTLDTGYSIQCSRRAKAQKSWGEKTPERHKDIEMSDTAQMQSIDRAADRHRGRPTKQHKIRRKQRSKPEKLRNGPSSDNVSMAERVLKTRSRVRATHDSQAHPAEESQTPHRGEKQQRGIHSRQK